MQLWIHSANTGRRRDPVDVLVLGDYPAVPMSIIRATPIGVLLTEDEEGSDAKVIAAPIPKIDPTFAERKDISGVPRHVLIQIEHFFEHYKDLQGKKTEITGWEGAEAAKAMIKTAQEAEKA